MTSSTRPLLDVAGLRVVLGHGRHATEVLHGIDLAVRAGTTVGIVGESGSGKSTIAKTLVGIHGPTAGTARFDGENLFGLSRTRRGIVRRRLQLIPQDPFSSLDPRRTIAQTLAEAIDPKRARVRAHRERIDRALREVALDASAAERYPHEFSGGQRQRIAIARALVTEPDLIVADEITSALDVSTQAEILALLADLRARLGLTMLFISHNLAVVREVCDDVVVLLRGEVVEAGPVASIFDAPTADYTRDLLASVPGGPRFRAAIAASDAR